MPEDKPRNSARPAGEPTQPELPVGASPQPTPSTFRQPAFAMLRRLWNRDTGGGLADLTTRLGTHALLLALVLLTAWGMREFYRSAQIAPGPLSAAAAPLPTQDLGAEIPVLPPFAADWNSVEGITRLAFLHTVVPARPRTDIMTYTVVTGDTVFAVAEKFGLKPETILWGNQFVLGDNPHNLRPEQVLTILPENGAYHRWSAGEGLNGVSEYFHVTPETIINYPGNGLDPATIGDYANPNIPAGKWLIIPGGRREFVSWSAPVIPRDNPAVASVLGPGACGKVVDGAVGAGLFIWPAPNHFLSGFDWAPNANHSGIDVDGDLGQPVYAVDNGVVVYAGWNNWGYGNVVVINHGNGWQTLYAHLSAFNVGCGQSVYQTNVIGAIGSTGNSSGPHLHFEMMYNGTKVNPHDYLP